MTDLVLLKKIGSKQILGTSIGELTKSFCENDGDVVDAYSVFGVANGLKSGESNFGEWAALTGQIRAVGHIGDAENCEYASQTCFAPNEIMAILAPALREHDSVEFAFTVCLKRRDDLDRGYEYVVKPKTEVKSADQITHLRNLALSKPEAEEKPKTKGRGK